MSEETKKTTVNAEAVEEKHTHKDGSTHSHNHEDHKKNQKKEADSATDTFNRLTESFDEFFNKQIPSLPVGFKEFLVKAIPYLSIAGLVLGVIGTIIALPLTLITFKLFSTVGLLIGIGSYVLTAMALPGLFSKSKKGWVYSYYSFLVSLLSSLVSLNLLGFILGGFIGGYFLFQIRSYYK